MTMFKAMLVILFVILSSNPTCAGQSNGPFWEDFAAPVTNFTNQYIEAARYINGALYVSTEGKLYKVYLDDMRIQNVTGQIRKENTDSITDILFDDSSRTFYIAINGNTHCASCYDEKLQFIKCVNPEYLTKWSNFWKVLEKNAPQKSSINVWAKDKTHACVGFFKGNIYYYDIQKNSYSLIYKTTNLYNWPTDIILTKFQAFSGTRGDGLIVFDRINGSTKRYKDKDQYKNSIRSLAIDEKTLYIGAHGLYKIDIGNLK